MRFELTRSQTLLVQSVVRDGASTQLAVAKLKAEADRLTQEHSGRHDEALQAAWTDNGKAGNPPAGTRFYMDGDKAWVESPDLPTPSTPSPRPVGLGVLRPGRIRGEDAPITEPATLDALTEALVQKAGGNGATPSA